MIPREAGRGRSFLGAGQYYLHDKQARSSERVAFTHTENVPTDDPNKALKWMAWTAMNAEELKREAGVRLNGQACSKPVFTFSLAWHPEEEPQQEEMVGAGRTALQALGLEKHEALMVAHSDRPHPHMHVIVNVIDPETGKAHSLSYSRLKLSEWAESYEREHGKIYCDQRVENNAKRQQGEYVKHQETEVDLKAQITQLYQQADCGAAFQAGLADLGYTLAQGKRPVLIDREGKIHSLYRQIDGAKAGDVKARLADLELPDVDEVRGQSEETAGTEQGTDRVAEEPEREDRPQAVIEENADPEAELFDRDQQDREWQESIIDAALQADQAKAKTHAPRTQPKPAYRPSPSPLQLSAMQDRHHAELRQFYTDNTQARQRLQQRLDQQYGEHERTLREEAEHLDNALANTGSVLRFWLKLTGQIPRDAEDELQNHRRTIENIEWRRSEAEQALEHESELQRVQMFERHRIERDALSSTAQHRPVQRDRSASHVDLGSDQREEDFGPTHS